MKKFDFRDIKKGQGIRAAYKKIDVSKSDLIHFKEVATDYLNNLDDAKGRDEEHFKGYLKEFLEKSFYSKENRKVQTAGIKGKIDLAIYSGSSVKSDVDVIIEVKEPSESSAMMTQATPNVKSLQQAVFYYIREKESGNDSIKNIIVTNNFEFFVFDAIDIDRVFYKTKALQKTYNEWKEKRKTSGSTQFMYKKIEEFIERSDAVLKPIYVDLRDFNEILTAPIYKDDDNDELIWLFKLFSPEHLVKKQFANDSNTLDKGFYNEFLYILGLKEDNKSGLIARLPKEERQSGSLIESTMNVLKYGQHMNEVRHAKTQYGSSEEDQLFGVALELVITWMNRVLFLKLMEAQLLSYHNNDQQFKFLSYDTIDEYDELNKLFFWVLALRPDERSEAVQSKFGHIPYLNSSLFDSTELEKATIQISGLDDKSELELWNKSILKKGPEETNSSLNTLEYLLRFLDAFNFSAETSGKVQSNNKRLINASVLGLIFEKINGYKDGSFFTPGFITEYMARETLRSAVVEKFIKEAGIENSEELTFSDLHFHIGPNRSVTVKEANEIINSITICDPAVGSGHFLVSCLNELIAIKSDLDILLYADGRPIRYLNIEVDNDELAIELKGELFEYNVNHKWKHGKVVRNYMDQNTQRLQETLFHEKKHLIENCLFGVDINPNSVKICRLRLWIELLKHAYYRADKDYAELEVLPNIDINIKQGNSLVSRFGLDDDLSSIFEKSEHSLKDYKEAVRNYRETKDRSEKQRLQQLIDDIKSEYSQGLLNNTPTNLELSKARAKYNALINQADIFGKKASKKEIAKAKNNLEEWKEKKAEDEAGVFFRKAFEWRFEFPEVLDKEGNYIGFDVVIGNPPYGTRVTGKLREFLVKNLSKVPDYEIYYWFIDLFKLINKENGTSSLIIPNTILFNVFAENYRMKLVKEVDVLEILDCTDFKIFEDATVRNAILTFKKANRNKKVGFRSTKNVNNFIELIQNERELASFENLQNNSKNWGLIFKLDKQVIELVSKIKSENLLNDYFDVSQGYIPYRKRDLIKEFGKEKGEKIVKNREWHSDKKVTGDYKQEIFGRNISKYGYSKTNSFVNYGKHLATYVEPRFFNSNRILVREITNPTIIAVLIEEEFVNDPQLISIIPKKDGNELFLLEHLWAILNSNLATFYHFNSSPKATKGDFPKILVTDLKEFPLPEVLDNSELIINLVKNILAEKKENPEADTSILEAEIDQLVYELYGLTDEEIAVVEESFN